MRTNYEMPEEWVKEFLELAEKSTVRQTRRPKRFIKKMRENTGLVGNLSEWGKDSCGLERKNPVIVALGDSVTAGHFEWCLEKEKLERFLKGEWKPQKGEIIEITDAREVYHERFRQKLIDLFEQTSVSVINSGIAGDTILGMRDRLERDVIRYQPDLVLINGSLNWDMGLGTTGEYKEILREVIRKITEMTEADIILMTPNMELPNPWLKVTSTLPERVACIRELAEEEQVCLADTYFVWEQFLKQGYELSRLLANGINHPSKAGHEVYALTLMKLFE